MTLQGKTVFVTGATGFVGGALARQLAESGVYVRALARSDAKAAFLRDVPNIDVVLGDITDAARMQALTAGCAVVFHGAAALGGPLVHQRRVNVEGTRHVMQAAAQVGVARVVHVSSVAVYGYPRAAVITEDMGPSPAQDAYSLTKAGAEDVVRELGAAQGVPYTIIRPGAIYGPRSNAWTARMFRLALRQPLIFPGDGRGSMPAIYIDDLIDLFRLAATHPAAAGEAFNATPDPSPTLRDYLTGYARLAGHTLRWIGLPVGLVKPVVWVNSRFGKPYSYRRTSPHLLDFITTAHTFTMAKACDRLGWQPQVDLETGIQRSGPWLRAIGLLDDVH